MTDESDFCFWLKGYMDGGHKDGIEPIVERLSAILENRLVIRLAAQGCVIDDRVDWFSQGGGVKSGPYKSQVEAWNALRLTEEEAGKHKREFPPDAVVWPEPHRSGNRD